MLQRHRREAIRLSGLTSGFGVPLLDMFGMDIDCGIFYSGLGINL